MKVLISANSLTKEGDKILCGLCGKTKHPGIKKGKDLHRTAQPSTLASIKIWGSSTGAGRISLTQCEDRKIFQVTEKFFKTGKLL